MSLRVATDIGGTFTDLVAYDERTGELQVAKASTTPGDFSGGVVDAVERGQVSLADVAYFVHGTTVVINAITERRGARTALVTTAGFRDVLEIGRGNRPDMYNLLYRKPPPFVPRRHRFEVRERVDRHGRVLVPLSASDVDAVVERLREERIEAVAVCLLHAYAHPEHELRCRDIIRERLPDVYVTVSCEITREWREYERTSTAVLNGYVQPAVDRYLDNLAAALRRSGLRRDFSVMQSNSGTATRETARARPIYLIESGPAAGIIGAARVGETIGEPNVIYLDIGGTTAKCSVIEDGEPKTTTGYKIEWRPDFAGYPVMVPVVDIVEIGAGGGSIAWRDASSALNVGPKSAGADPGPACYGRGGGQPTVTDAKLVAGVVDPDYFLGGQLEVHLDLARKVLARFGEPTGLAAKEVANGIIRLVNANMINALKLVSVRRGYDPRDFVLVACGGGGAMHAAALAAELQVKRVVIPPLPGVFSAWGMLVTEPRLDLIQTRILRTAETTAEEIADIFSTLEREAAERFDADGFASRRIYNVWTIDARYAGQEHTVQVGLRDGPPELPDIEREFHLQHRQKYTFDLPETPIELVTFHLASYWQADKPGLERLDGAGVSRPQPKGTRPVDFDVDGVHETRVYERSTLPTAFATEGPLVVEEPSSTTLVHPRQTLTVDDFGNLIVDL